MMAYGEPLSPRLPRIEPPQGYQPLTPAGVLRREKPEGDEGRLARLDAVVTVIMERDGLPCSAAVAAVCDELEAQGDALPLYLLQQTGFAVPLPANACFGGRDLYGLDIRTATCGRQGALRAMRNHWAKHDAPQCSVYEAAQLDCLAVPLRQACEMWGYGRADVPALALPSPEQLIPAAGWALKGEHGHMAFETTKAGRLVSLKALVHCLMDSQEMPCTMAVDAVCDKLQDPRAASWLYLVAHGKLAQPLAGDDDFSYLPVVTWDKRPSDPKDCGVAGALAHMRDLWGASASPSECNYMGAHTLDPLAIRMDVAHALWGWGSVGTAEAVAPAPAPVPVVAIADPLGALDADLRAAFEAVYKRRAAFKDVKNGAREPWPDDDVETVRKVREALGRSGAKTMAPLLCMADNGLRELLRRKPKDAQAPTPTANHPFPTAKPKAA